MESKTRFAIGNVHMSSADEETQDIITPPSSTFTKRREANNCGIRRGKWAWCATSQRPLVPKVVHAAFGKGSNTVWYSIHRSRGTKEGSSKFDKLCSYTTGGGAHFFWGGPGWPSMQSEYNSIMSTNVVSSRAQNHRHKMGVQDEVQL